ncbi:M48 family metallopeptidase [Actibacterium ureilyticum]|uniref:M48 family metallopeptidase n=1 Tax=Actibacterium ureilyticum TaxID=1590614 RepID=UPI000BAAF1CA|nr:SprT family zinc-dependent metalloprotease [Actibacterium ureilyticum]
MKRAELPGDPPITVTLRRSGRARRLSLRVSQLDGRVTLTLPNHAPEDEGLSFLREKEAWIRGHLDRRPQDRTIGPGVTIPFRGQPVEVALADAGRVRVEGARLMVSRKSANPGTAIAAFLKLAAREHLAARSDHHAATLGRGYERLVLRDTRSRWGSCSSQGALMYSWRLIMAPDAVSDYVAAHEVAHLVEMNHSPAFWRVVARLCPDYQTPRRWLRENGASLHAVRFGD